jgi:hypothetical protein
MFDRIFLIRPARPGFFIRFVTLQRASLFFPPPDKISGTHTTHAMHFTLTLVADDDRNTQTIFPFGFCFWFISLYLLEFLCIFYFVSDENQNPKNG